MKTIRRIFVPIISIVLFSCAMLIAYWNFSTIPFHSDAIAHFSIDDTMSLFIDLTQNQDTYISIFDNSTLRGLKAIHEKYGTKFSFYCFYQQEGFDLSMVPGCYHNEFMQNEDWLCFGYHAKSPSTELSTISDSDLVAEYNRTMQELYRITGSTTNTLRLSYYHGNKKAIHAIKSEGVETLFTNTKNKLSYYLDLDQMQYLMHNDYYNDGMLSFVHTDICLDDLNFFESRSRFITTFINPEQNDILVIYTHESRLDDNMMKTIDSLCGFLFRHGYHFVKTISVK